MLSTFIISSEFNLLILLRVCSAYLPPAEDLVGRRYSSQEEVPGFLLLTDPPYSPLRHTNGSDSFNRSPVLIV